MENELLDLCSRPSPDKPQDLERIAALLQVGVDPNCTNTDGQTPLLICLKNPREKPDEESSRLRILLEGNNQDEREASQNQLN